MKKLISAMFFAVLAATAAMADALDTTLFSKKSEMTISGYSGSTALENFPVLVRLAAGSRHGHTPVGDNQVYVMTSDKKTGHR